MGESLDHPESDHFLFRGATAPAVVGTGPVRIERRSLGMLDLPDGRIHACDPLVPMEVAPLAARLAPGGYEVVVFVAIPTEPVPRDTERIAAAAIVCRDVAPVTWELAAREGGAPDAAAYGVDAGTGSFFGTAALPAITDDEAAAETILAVFEQRNAAMITLPNGTTIAAFESGMGDGIYDTWIGRDADGEICIVLTDFTILDTADDVAAIHQRHAAKKWWQFWK